MAVDVALALQFVAIALLVGVSAVFSGVEAAFLSLSKVRIRAKANAGNARARVLLGLLQRPEKVVTTILVGNNVVNIVASALTARVALQLSGDVGLAVGTGILTFVVLVLGEATPKSFATRHPEFVALRLARPLRALEIVFLPVAWVLTGLANLVIRLFGGHGRLRAPFVTEDEIKLLVSIGEQEGTIEKGERELVHSVFRFSDLTARDVMTPLERVYRVPVTAKLEEALRLINESGHSRLPVFDTMATMFIGMVYAKDLLRFKDPDLSAMTVKQVLRPIGFVRATRRIQGVLREMQRQGHQIAIVISEAGEPLGLASVEDILEEIVGEIRDEYDLEALAAQARSSAAAETNPPRPPTEGGSPKAPSSSGASPDGGSAEPAGHQHE